MLYVWPISYACEQWGNSGEIVVWADSLDRAKEIVRANFPRKSEPKRLMELEKDLAAEPDVYDEKTACSFRFGA